MPRVKENGQRPQRELLYEIGLEQEGYFTLSQANQAGFSRQLLAYMLRKGEIERARRGIYRWAYFPLSEDSELIELWLWSEKEGVFSHQTALFLHQLSDALPSKLHMTLPPEWSQKRLQVPQHLSLYYKELEDARVRWFGAVQVTEPLETLLDCITAHVNPSLIEQALEEGLERGLFSKPQLRKECAKSGLSLPHYLSSIGL